MAITYLIGNGFDINMGLKTAYINFYPYFKNNASKDNLILKWLLNDENKKDIELWSDLEKAIGQKTELLQDDELEMFENDITELTDVLRMYLKEQEQKVDYVGCDSEILSKMSNSITSYIDDGSPGHQQIINSILEQYSPGNYTYNFINFNYTSILDKIISVCKKCSQNISFHETEGKRFEDVLGEVVHVHGTLENGMVVGVNDETQISSKKLVESKYKGCLIKSVLNKSLQNLNEENAIQMIKGSSIIVTFGFSIGETDKNWWVRIIQWLKSSNLHILVINVYDKNMEEYVNSHRIFISNRRKIEELEKVCGFEIESYVKERILIYYNKNNLTFNFNFLLESKKN